MTKRKLDALGEYMAWASCVPSDTRDFKTEDRAALHPLARCACISEWAPEQSKRLGKESLENSVYSFISQTSLEPVRLRTVLDLLNELIIIFDRASGLIVDVNKKVCERLGYSYDQLIGRDLDELIKPVLPSTLTAEGAGVGDGCFIPAFIDLLTLKGERLAVAAAVHTQLEDGSAHALLLASEVKQRSVSVSALPASEANFKLITDASIQGILVHRDWAVLYANNALKRIFGLPVDYDPANQWDMRELINRQEHERLQAYMSARMAGSDAPSCYEFEGVRRDGSPIWLENSSSPIVWDNKPAILTTVVDITERKRADDQLLKSVQEQRFIANHDYLTGLANRLLLVELLERALSFTGRRKTVSALFHIDLDRFKSVNDSLGHAAGDAVLRTVGLRLKAQVRNTDTVARIGGDEFVILFEDIADDPGEITLKAEAILRDIRNRIEIDGSELYLTASIGITKTNRSFSTTADLLREVDIAMYRAKALGGNTSSWYSKELELSSRQRIGIEQLLRKSIDSNQFRAVFQSQRSLSSGEVIGAEVLIRLPESESTIVSPAEFIPVAEQTGLILWIGDWIFRAACSQLRKWMDQYPGWNIPIVVNLSTVQFQQPNLVQKTAEVLAQYGVPSPLLEFEITESSLMQDPESSIRTMHKLREMNIGLSIDDFGTGYSSLSYLRAFPVQKLKIDRKFISGLPNAQIDAVIVRSVIAMAQEMNIKVVAEGIETSTQAEFLNSSCCDYGQGFFFDRPAEAGALNWLERAAGRR